MAANHRRSSLDRQPRSRGEAEIERIFEPFRRADASRAMVPGAGLGLWVARRVAEAHGGSLDVKSAPGQGSVFRLVLPLAEGAALSSSPSARAAFIPHG